MATTQKSNSERSRGADSESICPGCPNRFGKAKPAPRVLRHLLRTDVCPGYQRRDQVGVGRIKDFSPNSVGSTARPSGDGRLDGRAGANGHARTQTQEE